MAANDVSAPGDTLLNLKEGLVRRVRLKGQQVAIFDQLTKQWRLPAAAFESRLPANRPDATHRDEYVSVNILSSLLLCGLALTWGCDQNSFYVEQVALRVCQAIGLRATWEPIQDQANPKNDNPHHGGIWGLVEMFKKDWDAYDRARAHLAKHSVVLK